MMGSLVNVLFISFQFLVLRTGSASRNLRQTSFPGALCAVMYLPSCCLTACLSGDLQGLLWAFKKKLKSTPNPNPTPEIILGYPHHSYQFSPKNHDIDCLMMFHPFQFESNMAYQTHNCNSFTLRW